MSRIKPAATSVAAGSGTAGSANRRRGYRVGHDTRQMIVAVAGKVLVESGYQGLTLKRVADAAGISVGNLNYHFRTKESLVEALIEHVLTDFSSQFEDIVRRGVEDGSDALSALLRWAMDGSCAQQYTRLVRELWAMASHNRSVAAAMDRYYDQSITAAVGRMAGTRAPRSREEVTALMSLICIIAEGASAVFSRRGRRHPQYDAVQRLACSAVESAGRRLVKNTP
jgi:AcrR family transcriptional regulator